MWHRYRHFGADDDASLHWRYHLSSPYPADADDRLLSCLSQKSLLPASEIVHFNLPRTGQEFPVSARPTARRTKMKNSPGLNGAKIRAVWDGSSSRRDRRIQKPRVLTLGTVPPLRRALKGRQIECVNSTHLTKSALSPLQGESPYLMDPRVKTLG